MFTPHHDHVALWMATRGPRWARIALQPRSKWSDTNRRRIHGIINARANGSRIPSERENEIANTLHLLKLARATRTPEAFALYLRDMGYNPQPGARPRRTHITRRWLMRIYLERLAKAGGSDVRAVRALQRLRVPLESWPHVLRAIVGDLQPSESANA